MGGYEQMSPMPKGPPKGMVKGMGGQAFGDLGHFVGTIKNYNAEKGGAAGLRKPLHAESRARLRLQDAACASWQDLALWIFPLWLEESRVMCSCTPAISVPLGQDQL